MRFDATRSILAYTDRRHSRDSSTADETSSSSRARNRLLQIVTGLFECKAPELWDFFLLLRPALFLVRALTLIQALLLIRAQFFIRSLSAKLAISSQSILYALEELTGPFSTHAGVFS